MWSGRKLDVSMRYVPKRGWFGSLWQRNARHFETGHQVYLWNSCREEFHADTARYNGKTVNRGLFLFCVGSASRKRAVVAFMERIEGILGLSVRTAFGPTPRENVIWVRQPAWWRRSDMRRSLYTALLRSALWYNPGLDNLDYALNRRVYTSTTRKAVSRFLAGYTLYSGPKVHGWQSAFQGKSDDQIKLWLKRPKGAKSVA